MQRISIQSIETQSLKRRPKIGEGVRKIRLQIRRHFNVTPMRLVRGVEAVRLSGSGGSQRADHRSVHLYRSQSERDARSQIIAEYQRGVLIIAQVAGEHKFVGGDQRRTEALCKRDQRGLEGSAARVERCVQ